MKESFPNELEGAPNSQSRNAAELSPEESRTLELSGEHIDEAISETNVLVEKIDTALESISNDKNSPEAQDTRNQLVAIREKTKGLRNKFVEGTYMLLRITALGVAVLSARELGIKIDKPDFSKKDEAQKELQAKGITEEQRWAYLPGVNNLIERGINPYGYEGHDVKNFYDNIVHGRTVTGRISRAEVGKPFVSANREDAWRLYLGLPQEAHTFDISSYKPGTDAENAYYYKINGFPKLLSEYMGNDQDMLRWLYKETENGPFVLTDGPNLADIMGHFKISRGQDEKGHYFSYYDKWKLDVGPEKNGGFFGKPFEIYDRIYYDPESFSIIETH